MRTTPAGLSRPSRSGAPSARWRVIARARATVTETLPLGRFGVRSREIAEGDLADSIRAVRELEELGFGTVWMNASPVLERGAELAAATDRIVIGSSVASIWNYDPRQLAESFLRLDEARPGRFLLGIGISHAPIVERTAPGREYDKPVETMNRWLDEMDALRNGVPSSRRIVAALAPRMLRLAGVRSLGSHPYLVPVGHSQVARRLLGPRALLAPAHAVVVEPDEARARAIGRRHINNPYLQLPNYAKTWMRHGLEPADLENGGSDRLVDELVAWGPPAAIAVKLGGHIAAGADHVAVQVLGDDSGSFPRSQWRALAAVLVR